LREELANPKMEKKKEAVKKVIAAMTVGKDVSMLFTDVVNCIQTARASRSPRSPRATAPPLPPPLHPILAPRPRLRRERLAQVNIELKKLVYLYLINYAKSQPDLAILAVNTFVKDTQAATPLAAAAARAAVERRRRATDYPPSSERLSPPPLRPGTDRPCLPPPPQDVNPLIRALAVRTMGCIRVDKIVRCSREAERGARGARRTRGGGAVKPPRLCGAGAGGGGGGRGKGDISRHYTTAVES